MDDTRIERGRVEQYARDQLVVALPEQDLVREELQHLGVTVAPEAPEDERLGLVLLTLPMLDEQASSVRDAASTVDGERKHELEATIDTAIAEATDKRPSGRPALSALDLLLIVLRKRFAFRFRGWEPSMGKNRTLEQVKGYPHLGGGIAGQGSGDPEPIDPPKQFTQDDPGSAHQAWPGTAVRVAILDTKLAVHPYLIGRFLAAPDAMLRPAPPGTAAQPATPPRVTAGHATFIAGLILLRAPGAQLDVYPVLDDRAVGDTWTLARKIAQLAGSGVEVINCSCGCYTDDGQKPLVLSRAVEQLGTGVAVVAAAGNHGDLDNEQRPAFPNDQGLKANEPSWPAAFDSVIAVGATNAKSELARFTPRTPWINLLAPGVDVESTYLTGRARAPRLENGRPVEKQLRKSFKGFARWSGTSFAAAAVSGAIAAHGIGHVQEAVSTLLVRPDDDIRPFTLADLG